mmetsp:Transcript_17478/g.49975  ORF Transcript_17478/g.49975 Transcript_17478/m.49975 type:complete len:172 (+) Transcript_17478:697-1212(+)
MTSMTGARVAVRRTGLSIAHRATVRDASWTDPSLLHRPALVRASPGFQQLLANLREGASSRQPAYCPLRSSSRISNLLLLLLLSLRVVRLLRQFYASDRGRRKAPSAAAEVFISKIGHGPQHKMRCNDMCGISRNLPPCACTCARAKVLQAADFLPLRQLQTELQPGLPPK